MDRNLWQLVYSLVMTTDYPTFWPPQSVTYSDRVIVLVELWATAHDQSILWATHPQAWRWPDLMPPQLPHQSTMSRRQKTPAVTALRDALYQRLRLMVPGDQVWLRYIDGRGLTVSGCSKDPQARWGYAAKTLAKGYKLHVLWDQGLVPAAWEVYALNVAEQKVAAELVQRLPEEATGYLVADSNYDSNPLHQVTSSRHLQLVAPPQKKGRGLGHRRHEPSRLRALQLIQGKFGVALLAQQGQIERRLGHLVTNPAGLDRLPWHVRRRTRVRRHVQLKLILEGCYRWLQPSLSSRDRAPVMPLRHAA